MFFIMRELNCRKQERTGKHFCLIYVEARQTPAVLLALRLDTCSARQLLDSLKNCVLLEANLCRESFFIEFIIPKP